ncbi:hypothetical protein BGZ70_000290 [Mortierella alpina]|uniref:F-box domain-containing protein n=1 Tax=Mortierella alpina TaxID=64518 RepID=A0A9P6M639_MORAP|nr:hypothetical protein BGZ70_000290 [Mortierella alpina]
MIAKPLPYLPPEILMLIAQHQSMADMVSCLQVCSAWHSAMIYKIWRQVHFWESEPEPPLIINPTMDALQHHQHFIRHLRVPESFANDYCSRLQPFLFVNVESLEILCWSEALSAAHFTLTRELEVLPSLETIHLDSVDPTVVSWVLRSISALPKLTAIIIKNTVIGRQSALNLWRVLPQLKMLILEEVLFTDMTAVKETMATTPLICPHLRILWLDLRDTDLDPFDQADLVLACPALGELKWYSLSVHYYQFTSAFIRFNQALKEGRFPDLSIFRCRGDCLDTQIATVLQSMRLVVELRSQANDFGPESFLALRPHFSRLAFLDVQNCEDMTSTMVQTVLCSCPVLESLLVDWMWATDAIQEEEEEEEEEEYEVEDDDDDDGGEEVRRRKKKSTKKAWVCGSTLRHLCLSFRFREGETNLQPKVYESLAQLTGLEGFMMAKRYRELEGEQGLLLLLEHGLEKLTTWKILRYVNFIHDPLQVLGETELAWMLEHWKDLNVVIGSTDHANLSTGLNADIQRRQIVFPDASPDEILEI